MVAARSARAAESEVRVFVDEPIGTISPFIHGHFIEHLGGLIYDGVWVGGDSKVHNVRGIRKSLIDAMREIGPTVMRWPGGCFADGYDWCDGIGPRNSRPHRLNFWASRARLHDLPDTNPSKNDPNSFGTNEFLRFTKLINAEPYIAANVRGMTAMDSMNGLSTATLRPAVPAQSAALPMAIPSRSMSDSGASETKAGDAAAI